jgi:predicted ester cyclase
VRNHGRSDAPLGRKNRTELAQTNAVIAPAAAGASTPGTPKSPLLHALGIAVNKTELSDIYRGYITCLNQRGWSKLEQFVADDVCRNGQQIGLSDYRKMLEKDFSEIPDLYFDIQLLISDPPYIASRLAFNCTPKGNFLGLDVSGKRVSFTENVFYEFREEKVVQVWSVIDKPAIEAQLWAVIDHRNNP